MNNGRPGQEVDVQPILEEGGGFGVGVGVNGDKTLFNLGGYPLIFKIDRRGWGFTPTALTRRRTDRPLPKRREGKA